MVVVNHFGCLCDIILIMKDNILGKNLKELRLERKMTAVYVANSIGISIMAYRHYEWGDREPPLDILVALCHFFEVSSDYLLGLSPI